MLEQSKINKLLDNFESLKKNIKAKKQVLNKLNSQKESWFKKKREISTKIFAKINELRSSKSKVDNIDKEVVTLNSTKNEVSDKISKLIGDVKNLKQKYRDGCSKHGITKPPSVIKKKIQTLEYALETSAMGFEQEKKVNKEIKKLKKFYSQMADINKFWIEISKKEKQISMLKGQKSGTLNKLKADNNQKYDLSEDFIANSKEIMDMRKIEAGYFDKFTEFKDQFKEKNNELKVLLKEKEESEKVLQLNNVELKDFAKKAEAAIIKEKSAEVKEKIKKREKLTTEDLLVFQRANK
jgi:uncharacterized coiled-coil DUF342 family protein